MAKMKRMRAGKLWGRSVVMVPGFSWGGGKALKVEPNNVILRLFAAHVLHQVTLWQIGDIGLQQAVDGLRSTAYRQGLIERFGRPEIEQIIGAAFEDAGVHYGDIRPKEGAYP